jgi:uroporphyrinogen-III decarboxylase
VPKGKVLYHFERVDMARAKDILGDVSCIAGNVPNSLLIMGTPEDVKDYCRKLIDTVGKGGGFIMDSAAIIDEARPENVKAMGDLTREYGVYS